MIEKYSLSLALTSPSGAITGSRSAPSDAVARSIVTIIGSLGGLIMLQPNLGTTLIILLITVTMFWVAGASLMQMLALGVAGFVAMALLATVAGYRADRLTAFFNAETDPLGHGFQTLQSLIALQKSQANEPKLKRVELKMRVTPEQLAQVQANVLAALAKEADVVCEVSVLAQSDEGIRQSTIEVQVRDWLDQQGIPCELHKDFIKIAEYARD